MDPNTPPLAPCYECGRLTHRRLRRTWFVDAPYRDDDGQVLLPGTPVCDTVEHEDDTSCLHGLYSETSDTEALARKIETRYARYDWTPLGGNGVTRPEPREAVCPLRSETTNAAALAAKIHNTRCPVREWAPLGGNGVTRPEPHEATDLPVPGRTQCHLVWPRLPLARR